MRILIIEDEKRLAQTLADLVENSSFAADIANDGLQGLEMAKSGMYDAIILDVMLPGLNGFEVLSCLRKEHNSTPVLMLTARGELENRVRGLNAGADYYLTKPFENEELLACLRSILRRPSYQELDSLQFGDLTLTPSTLTLACGGREQTLSAREMELLRMLMQNSRQFLSKETLLVKIWGYDGGVTANNVEAYISFLRKKIALSGSSVRISMARNVGYRLEDSHA